VNRCLNALGLSKGAWHYAQNKKISFEKKNKEKRSVVTKIVRRHTEYGYRRIEADLRAEGRTINHKLLKKLLKWWDLGVIRRIKRPKPSAIRKIIMKNALNLNLVSKLKQIGIFQGVYTDFTEIVYQNGKLKVYLMTIVDAVCKLVLGWALGKNKDAQLALVAFSKMTRTLMTYGKTSKGIMEIQV